MNNDYDRNNIFAKILKSEISCTKIDENDNTLAFLDINPQSNIHILIIPKKPYMNIYDFNKNASDNEILDFWKLVNNLIEKQNIKEKGFRIITNSGKDGNQDVMHFHIHLLGGENLGRMITLNS